MPKHNGPVELLRSLRIDVARNYPGDNLHIVHFSDFETSRQFHQRSTYEFFIRISPQSQNVTRKRCRNNIRTKNSYVERWWNWALESSLNAQILHTNVFILVTFWLWTNFCTKNACKKRWWNWAQGSIPPKWLCPAFTCTDPKSGKRLTACLYFFFFWDLRT